jgi:transcription initiation factor TFIIIB Brf1 subunit/transcription initiation factor TFIIB
MKVCNICEKMNQYKRYQNKWCSTCKVYIENERFDEHIHSNLFARSKFDFRTSKRVKQQYFDEIKRRIDGGAASYLKKAVTVAYLDRVLLTDLLPESDVKDLKHSNITNVKSLLLNIDYFKKETFRETHYRSVK